MKPATAAPSIARKPHVGADVEFELVISWEGRSPSREADIVHGVPARRVALRGRDVPGERLHPAIEVCWLQGLWGSRGVRVHRSVLGGGRLHRATDFRWPQELRRRMHPPRWPLKLCNTGIGEV